MNHPLHRAIEAEHSEPFWDVVRGYAAQGCSRKETARLLGYRHTSPFLKLLRRHPEIAIPWPDPTQCNSHLAVRAEARTPGSPIRAKLLAATRAARAANPTTVHITLDGITAPLSHHMRRLGSTLTLSGVARRIKRGWPAREAICTPSVAHLNAGRRNIQQHPWIDAARRGRIEP